MRPFAIACGSHDFAPDLCFEVVASIYLALWSIPSRPGFDKPYLSTSVRELWGKRWHQVRKLTALDSLRSRLSVQMLRENLKTIGYHPVRELCRRRGVSDRVAQALGVFTVFVMSALMHEYQCQVSAATFIRQSLEWTALLAAAGRFPSLRDRLALHLLHDDRRLCCARGVFNLRAFILLVLPFDCSQGALDSHLQKLPSLARGLLVALSLSSITPVFIRPTLVVGWHKLG